MKLSMKTAKWVGNCFIYSTPPPDLRIYGYALSVSVVEYQTAILSGDSEAAAEILPLWLDLINLYCAFST